jgi:hypothetical protein
MPGKRDELDCQFDGKDTIPRHPHGSHPALTQAADKLESVADEISHGIAATSAFVSSLR